MTKAKESKLRAFIKEHFMIVVMLAIMMIPSIYTVLFLGSMWDPYGNTGNLPVAIVNQDQAVVYNGKEVNVGQQLCDNLEKNDALQFNFVDEKVALKGLENGTYYMVMVIPRDFSANSTTLTTDSPEKMKITYYTNPGTNYIASKFGESAVKTIKESLNKQVINTYATTVYSKLDTIGEGFNAAADGSNQIYNGVGKLRNGNGQITNGLDTLSNGCLTLKEGTGTLKDGLKTYTDGVKQVDDGITQVSSGLKQLDEGVDTLNNGVGTLKAGTSQLTANNKALNDGATQLLEGLTYMSTTLDQSLTEKNLQDLKTLEDGLLTLKGVVDKVGDVKTKADAVLDEETVADIQSTVNDVNTFVNSDAFGTIYEIIDYDAIDWNEVIRALDLVSNLPLRPETKNTITKLKEYANKMIKIQEFEKKFTKEDIQNLVNQANQLVQNYNYVNSQIDTLVNQGSYALEMGSSTLKTLSNGLLSVQYGLEKTQAKNGETGLIEGMTTLKNGIATYTGGVSQVDAGVSQLVDGAKKLDGGVAQLSDGTDKLKAGTKKLVSNNSTIMNGAKKLNNGAGQLYDGSKKLYDGSLQIDDGCEQLMIGANTLEVSLRDGAQQIDDTNTGEDAADMFSQPVVDKEVFQRNINSNGEAMSAYMMCAGMWVACLAFCLMFSPFKTSLKSRKTFISHGFIATFVAVMSPIIMVTLLMVIDGMRPAHMVETYLMAILTSVAFMSIVYFLNTLMDSIGSFVLLIFLCMNLSGSAGTYPINLSPKFYQAIHNFMPFTYGVDAFRSTISTGNSLNKDIIVFSCITAVCIVLTCLTYEFRHKQTKRKIRKEIMEEQAEELSYYNNPELI